LAERRLKLFVQGSTVQKFNRFSVVAVLQSSLRQIVVSRPSSITKKIHRAFFVLALLFFGLVSAMPLRAASVSSAESDRARTVEAATKEGKVSVFLYQR
jgi:hypothetical protein